MRQQNYGSQKYLRELRHKERLEAKEAKRAIRKAERAEAYLGHEVTEDPTTLPSARRPEWR